MLGEYEMISDHVFSFLRHVYFKESGDNLSSIFGGDSDDKMRFSRDSANCSFFEFHESRKTLISSKTNPKTLNHSCNKLSLKLEGRV